MKKNEKRQNIVLEKLVEYYINNNESVSSRLIGEEYLPDVSQATLRIDLAKLEEKGYIYQPHTSSGRLPTIAGYREYLKLKKEEFKKINYSKVNFLRKILVKNYKDIGSAIQYIKQIIAGETNQLSFVAEPEFSYGFLRSFKAFKIDKNKVLFVVSIDSGVDKTIILKLDYELYEQQLKALVKYVNEEFGGLRIYDIQNKYLNKDPKYTEQASKLLLDFLREFNFALKQVSDYNIYFDSKIDFLLQDEFNSKEMILKFFGIMQNHEFLLNLMQNNLNENEDYSILMGEQLNYPNWNEFVLIYAKYEIYEVPGFLGVLAPIRVDYKKIIPIVRDITKTITNTTRRGAIVKC